MKYFSQDHLICLEYFGLLVLGQYPDINWFASNGLTSPQMLQDTYLKYISKEASLNESKKKMRHSDYSLTKRVAA